MISHSPGPVLVGTDGAAPAAGPVGDGAVAAAGAPIGRALAPVGSSPAGLTTAQATHGCAPAARTPSPPIRPAGGRCWWRRSTQTLIIFAIRTRRVRFIRSRPGLALTLAVLALYKATSRPLPRRGRRHLRRRVTYFTRPTPSADQR